MAQRKEFSPESFERGTVREPSTNERVLFNREREVSESPEQLVMRDGLKLTPISDNVAIFRGSEILNAGSYSKHRQLLVDDDFPYLVGKFIDAVSLTYVPENAYPLEPLDLFGSLYLNRIGADNQIFGQLGNGYSSFLMGEGVSVESGDEMYVTLATKNVASVNVSIAYNITVYYSIKYKDHIPAINF